MLSDKIKISDIIGARGGTIDELCLYARNKGINIPPDPDYVLSISELNAIDPILAWNIKYGKRASPKVYNLGNSENHIQSPLPKASQLENIGKTDDGGTKKSKGESQRIIGVVKFFDPYKGWGFFVTNGKGIQQNLEEGKLISLHITSWEWQSSPDPTGNELVIFSARRNSRGWNAINAERLEYNRENLVLAMKYRAKYACIKGTDIKGDSFHENILCHIIEKMTSSMSDSDKKSEVVDCFCEYVSKKVEHKQEALVYEFLEDPNLAKLLLRLFIESKYTSENDAKFSVYSLFTDILVSRLFEKGNLSDLSVLPVSFDYAPYIDKLTTILVNEAKNNGAIVKNWLGNHDVSTLLVLDNTDVETIPLRLILKNLTNNASWIDDLNADWNTVREFIKANTAQAYSFCKQLFTDKDEEFVKEHELADILDDGVISRWCNDLMSENEIPSIFLRALMGNIDSLELWGIYVQKGFDVTSSAAVLRDIISDNLIRSNTDEVRTCLSFCN